ncbi:hypothetical protein ASG29_08290 [Sphingomonas sp. Leaf412]|uniref:HAD hydrolase-like protein n=1 Tax=Sphingomonas sp. Leaf412 TaxID=1736370 RepID=UPI0006F5ADE4|nr:HAD hydrolase-like protein [Sphingomonas sp. Leaf412]KQT31877.1 hypothetical protein ASG29_08290 [Sphingomonas sp. Leaf412]
MTSFPFQIVGFDLDGTLLDTGDDLAAAVNHTLSLAGRAPLSRAVILSHVGGGVQQLLHRVLDLTGGTSPALEADLLPRHGAWYRAHLTDHTAPYPGAVAALEGLAARGATLAVVTNKREAISRELLDRLGLADRFACIIGGDTMPRNKPAPDPIREMLRRCGGTANGRRAAFVGDSRYDVEAAHSAGLPVVGCHFGFGHDTPGADATIDRFDRLIPVLEAL